MYTAFAGECGAIILFFSPWRRRAATLLFNQRGSKYLRPDNLAIVIAIIVAAHATLPESL
jgi:hypothetical protein